MWQNLCNFGEVSSRNKCTSTSPWWKLPLRWSSSGCVPGSGIVKRRRLVVLVQAAPGWEDAVAFFTPTTLAGLLSPAVHSCPLLSSTLPYPPLPSSLGILSSNSRARGTTWDADTLNVMLPSKYVTPEHRDNGIGWIIHEPCMGSMGIWWHNTWDMIFR